MAALHLSLKGNNSVKMLLPQLLIFLETASINNVKKIKKKKSFLAPAFWVFEQEFLFFCFVVTFYGRVGFIKIIAFFFLFKITEWSNLLKILATCTWSKNYGHFFLPLHSCCRYHPANGHLLYSTSHLFDTNTTPRDTLHNWPFFWLPCLERVYVYYHYLWEEGGQMFLLFAQFHIFSLVLSKHTFYIR